LPIVERWDCTGCGKCCRGNLVPLDDDDLRRLRDQRWDQHPDYRGTPTVVRQGFLRRRYRLAQRDDGRCVFLTDEGLCRIHQEFGFETKPLVCRMYPLQLVPVDKTAYLTLRRSCPTAAAGQGREMRAHRDAARAFVRERPKLVEPVAPPTICRGQRRSWKDTLLVLGGLEQLLTDQRFPLVRRLVHGLRFCELLERCRLKKVDTLKLRELIEILVQNSPQEGAAFFREVSPPQGGAAVLFRQITADYLRLHPGYIVRESWNQRLRMASVAFAFARGRGLVPRLHAGYPEAQFEQIESCSLGHQEESLQEPLVRYFESTAASKQYAMAGRSRWSLVEKYRALAAAYPVALWMLRYFCQCQPPTVERVIDVVTAIDRGQGFAPLAGRQHRRRLAQLASMEALEGLAVWYAR
jgi:Fe-S-cluster containining protein